jgi:hypothetical protein
MHRPAPSAAATFDFAVHLSHDGIGRHAARQGMAMLAVGRNDAIAGFKGLHATYGDRFFTYIEVEKAADLAALIQLGALFFQAPDAQHLAKQMEPMFPIDRRLLASIFCCH